MKRKKTAFFLLFIALSFFHGYDCAANPGIVPAAIFAGPEMPGSIPSGWRLETKTGKPLLNLLKDGNSFYLHLVSAGNSSFGLRRELRVDVKKYPILCWRWRVEKLPQGGDVRRSSTDDQALQIYVAFKESGLMGLNTPVIGYIWDNEAPKGWSGRSQQVGGDKLRYIVVRNKTDQVGQWYTERRNIYKDYQRLFADLHNGEPQGPTTGIQLHINSQRTKSHAEGMIGEIYFSGEAADITLAEAGLDAPPEKTVKISAIKPPPDAVKPTLEPPIGPECVNLNVEFDPGSTEIAREYQDVLRKAAEHLQKNAGLTLNVVGHTDNVGNEKFNLHLSQRRAAVVKDYLVQKLGVESPRIHVRGVGAAKPIASNETPEGRRQNRRVSISSCPEPDSSGN